MTELTDERIQELVAKYINESIAELDRQLYDNSNQDYLPPFSDTKTFSSYVSDLDNVKDELVHSLP